MRPLSAQAIVRAWELGQMQHPIDRALTVLCIALPGRTRAELAVLPLSQRDRLLLQVREATFGAMMRALTACRGCGERVEFEIRTDSLRQLHAGTEEHALTLESGDVHLCLRLPNSLDMAAAATCGPDQDGERLLFERCVVEAQATDGGTLEAAHLPRVLQEAAEARLADLDPLLDVTFEVGCSACGVRWTVPLDIAAYLWAELAAEARRLLAEVHVLARSYGWREADILGMSPLRRRSYLEMVGASA